MCIYKTHEGYTNFILGLCGARVRQLNLNVELRTSDGEGTEDKGALAVLDSFFEDLQTRLLNQQLSEV